MTAKGPETTGNGAAMYLREVGWAAERRRQEAAKQEELRQAAARAARRK